jgi:hypothetical protein
LLLFYNNNGKFLEADANTLHLSYEVPDISIVFKMVLEYMEVVSEQILRQKGLKLMHSDL